MKTPFAPVLITSLVLIIPTMAAPSPAAAAEPDRTGPELATRSVVPPHEDCLAAEVNGLVRGCDHEGNYFTCTNGTEVLFTCTGGCTEDANHSPRCNDGVAVWQGSY